MCGCNSGSSSSGGSVADPMAQSSQRVSDDQIYVVTYFNGVSEEAVGLDRVRTLLITPSERVEDAQDVIQGGTYYPKG